MGNGRPLPAVGVTRRSRDGRAHLEERWVTPLVPALAFTTCAAFALGWLKGGHARRAPVAPDGEG